MKKFIKVLITSVIIVAVTFASFFVYVNDYYEADLGAVPVMAPTVSKRVTEYPKYPTWNRLKKQLKPYLSL